MRIKGPPAVSQAAIHISHPQILVPMSYLLPLYSISPTVWVTQAHTHGERGESMFEARPTSDFHTAEAGV